MDVACLNMTGSILSQHWNRPTHLCQGALDRFLSFFVDKAHSFSVHTMISIKEYMLLQEAYRELTSTISGGATAQTP
jgi:hypothetical protein